MGSVSEENTINQAINSWKPNTIFHAAAYKHVSLVEQNIIEGIKNNVFGTINILKALLPIKSLHLYLYQLIKQLNPLT